MAAVALGAAAELNRRCSADDVTTGKVLFGLRCSLAREAVDDELYEDLEAVLGEDARPDPHQVKNIAWRFRQATTRLVEILPYIVIPYPLAEIRRVIDVSAEQPAPEEGHGHLVRLALAILALLDLMGEAAQ